MGKIRCSIVGLGRIGSLLEEDKLREKPCTHAGAIVKNRSCVLAAGCDIKRERQELFSRRWGCPRVYADIDDMLSEVPTDVLHIATPPETHRLLVERALSHDVRVIVCEKPLAPTSSEALKIANFHASGKAKILTNHERRYSGNYLMVKRRIERAPFGHLLSIQARLFMGERVPVTDVLLEDGTHLVDIIQFLSGQMLCLSAVELYAGRLHESLFVICRAGEVPAVMEIGSGRNYIDFELDLSFERGRIRIGNGLYEEYRSGKSPYYEKMSSLLRTGAAGPAVTGYFTRMLRDAVACFRDEARMPVSSALDGYRTVAFIDAVKKKLGSM